MRKTENVFVVLDIDNTLAKTWQILKPKSGIKFYYELDPLQGTLDEIKSKYKNKSKVYISNRNPFTYFVTLNWLEKHNLFDRKNDLLILTNFPKNKLYYIDSLVRKGKRVFYYDDLSYNHENGNVKFYSDVIIKVKKLDITYFDYEYINKLNSNDFTSD
jgi:hypothetical protein